ncbi:hypothetical protein TNCV_2968831 [Trichonephila clavipes]|nr:hypothetical protein TNCV_2968831 [Trichonephila clavipes]
MKRDSSLGAVRHLSGGSDHEDLWGAEEMTSSRCVESNSPKVVNSRRRGRRSTVIGLEVAVFCRVVELGALKALDNSFAFKAFDSDG